MTEVILVEDDDDLRDATVETLEREGFRVHAFNCAAPALRSLSPDFTGVILSDLRMPGFSGLEFLDQAQSRARDVPFILITAHGDIPVAIRAVRAGAFDFLEKPCSPELMLTALRRAQAMRDMHLENARLRQARIDERMIGRSPVMQDLRQRLRSLAGLHLDLLIAGETGTGKELAARLLHDLSPHAAGPFVAVNCGALTEAEIDRELFGTSDTKGLVARAEGGSLYLDELEAMPDILQGRLLRVVETREITPLGAAPRPVELRVLASVKRLPEALIEEGKLRLDLFHRFNAAIALPPLRDRDGDALLLIDHFVADAARRHDLPKPHLDNSLRQRIGNHPWPGNVREARNYAEGLVIGLDEGLVPAPGGGTSNTPRYDAAMSSFEARLLRSALIQTGGRKSDAAELLGVPRKRLYLRLRHHGML